MIKPHAALAPCLLLSVVHAASSGPAPQPAPATAGDSVAVETFTGPRRDDMATPRYPEDQVHRGGEGWVHLNFMVDTAGKPYEIAVADAVGDEEFQHEAVRALRRSTFHPAELNGRAIEAGYALTFQFELSSGRDGARRRFAHKHRRLLEAIESGDRAAADAQLESLEPENLFENAYLHLGKSAYFRRWGSPHEELAALRRAVGRDEDKSYLPDDLLAHTLRSLFALQAQTQDFAGALATASRLDGAPLDDAGRAMLDQAVEQIQELQVNDQPFAIDGRIGPSSTSWFIRLFKSEFVLDQVQGRVAEIKLRCAGKFVGFAFDPELSYSVVEQYMPCQLEVVGDPDTTFRLIQS